MLTIRPFRNVDPPAVAEIWRSRAGQRGLVQPVSVDLFEQLIFGKPHFHASRLLLAFEDQRPLGFTHAAFGPSRRRDWISTHAGITCVIVVRPDCAETEVAGRLLEASEAYLTGCGAKDLYGGAGVLLAPFYWGLYGGCAPPGVLDSDRVAKGLYQSHGYHSVEKTLICRRELSHFRPPTDRRLMQIRRRMSIHVTHDPQTRDWWDACTRGDFELTRYDLLLRGRSTPLATVMVRDMAPSNGMAPGQTAGILDVTVDRQHRRQALATFLLGEVFRRLVDQGVTVVEGHASDQNAAAMGLCRKLGLEEIERGTVFRKQVPPEA